MAIGVLNEGLFKPFEPIGLEEIENAYSLKA
jgi:hypothetical protein